MELKQLTTKEEADKVLQFFYSGKAFYWELPEWQKESIRERVDNALSGKNKASYWFFEDDQDGVIAAGSVEEDEAKNGGFFIGWLGVHEDHRRKGLGKKIIEACEDYVKSLAGRIPEYYGINDDKVIYYKKL